MPLRLLDDIQVFFPMKACRASGPEQSGVLGQAIRISCPGDGGGRGKLRNRQRAIEVAPEKRNCRRRNRIQSADLCGIANERGF
jgi:hypothetical protein